MIGVPSTSASAPLAPTALSRPLQREKQARQGCRQVVQSPAYLLSFRSGRAGGTHSDKYRPCLSTDGDADDELSFLFPSGCATCCSCFCRWTSLGSESGIMWGYRLWGIVMALPGFGSSLTEAAEVE